MNLLLKMDFAVLDFIQKYLRCGFLDAVLPIITTLGNKGIIWIVLGVVLLLRKRTRRLGIMVLLALAMCLIIGNITLKPLIGRIRPFDINTVMEILISKPKDFSFPSGHTMSSFAAATVIFLKNRKAGIGALILASVIGFSRLYLYVHYPSDVLGGLLIGVMIANITVRLFEKTDKKNKSTE